MVLKKAKANKTLWTNEICEAEKGWECMNEWRNEGEEEIIM